MIKISIEKQKEIISLYNELKSITKVSKKLKIACSTISKILKENNIDTQQAKGCKLSKEIEEKAISMFKEGYSLEKIHKNLGISRDSFSKKLKKMGYEILSDGKKHINSNIFEKIDTEEKAYWLGFLMADGYVSKNSNKIELQIKDKEHLEKFKNFLDSKHKISERKNILNGKEFVSYRISICDKQIHQSLISLGCIPNKTFEMHIPNIDDNLFRHWLRGYFDGDGCIFCYNKKPFLKGRYHISLSSGNLYILQEILEKLNELFPFKNIKVKNTKTCYEIRTMNILDTQLFLDLLYKDSTIYLDRKFELYNRYCRLETRTKRKKGVSR